MKPTVLILAGARPGVPDPVAAAEGVPHKALAVVAGRTLLERVVGAARAYGASQVVVCADHPAVATEAERLGVARMAMASGPSESVVRAFERYGAPLLVTTADHALLEPEWLRALAEETPPGTDAALMMARRELVEAAAPETRRTWVKLADGDWSGCNLFLLASPSAALAATTWQQAEAERKRPWRFARRLGLATWLDYILGRMTIDEAIDRLGRRFGLNTAVVPAPDGRAAIDVDCPGDLALVRRLVGEGEAEHTAPALPA